jgi:hypothetical protein
MDPQAVAFNSREEVFRMAGTVRLLAIVDLDGNVMAVQLPDESARLQDQEVPSSTSFQPLPGQRLISIDFPREVLQLPGDDLHHFLSDIKVNWPVEVQMPEIKLVKKTDHPSKDRDE